jgi:rubrerythrin
MSDSDYYSAINTKLSNRKQLFNKKIKVSNKENNITNDLLYYYDKNFDSYYDKNSKLNNTIESSEKIIDINRSAADQKIKQIFILKSSLLFLFVNVLNFIFHSSFHLYKSGPMCLILALSSIALLYYIIRHVYYNNFAQGQFKSRQFADGKHTTMFKEAVKNIFPHYMTRDKCPKGCKRKHPPSRCPKDIPNCQEIDPVRIKDMHTDSTLNNWEKGDILHKNCAVIHPNELNEDEKKRLIRKGLDLNKRLLRCPLKNPVIGENGETIRHIIMNEPEPWYSGLDDNINSNTVYKCKWDNVGEPIGDQGYEFNSKIPCDYYIGYKTEDKLIGNERV